jgi:HEAT repeat protein
MQSDRGGQKREIAVQKTGDEGQKIEAKTADSGLQVSGSGRGAKPQASPTNHQSVAKSAVASWPSDVSPAGREPTGAGRIIGLLRRAVQINDHAAIKSCLDQLVALGDQAVAPLTEFVTGGQDGGCVWAAEALARIGTPTATASLLNALSQMNDGSYKDQIAKRVSNISNHDSWPVLLDAMQTTEDASVRRSVSASLSRMADAPIVDELIARYDAAATVDEAADLARVVGSISSSKATNSLLALARQIPSRPEDPLDQSILDAIANVGDPQCVSFLLTKLEGCGPGEGAYMMNVIGKINQPQAQTSLLYAAAGSKDVSAEQGRTAAVLALKNFPNEQTYVLLDQIASTERNAALASAATRTLADIRRVSPMLAANAQVKPNEQILLPVNPARK